MQQTSIPTPSLRRLPIYRRRLRIAVEKGIAYVSSRQLGLAAGVPAAQVRKDLSWVEQEGRPGRGYEARALADDLDLTLGLHCEKRAVVVGVGNLGSALAAYPGFSSCGLRVVALFDKDPDIIGKDVAGLTVQPVEELADVARRDQVDMGIITVPAEAAQTVADAMVDAGIHVVWNFAPTTLRVDEGVYVHNQDLVVELAVLSHQIVQRRGGECPPHLPMPHDKA
ncbi:MAG: redox-sensing transcriptional repressor Rex [Anaerolineae bacterium]